MKRPPMKLLLAYVAYIAAAATMASAGYCGPYETLVCNLQPTAGNSVTGRILFRQVPVGYWWWWRRCNVRISAKISGLANTNGKQGWHIHSYGDTLKDDGSTTAGHFTSPNNGTRFQKHGFPEDYFRHWGCLGNLVVNSEGVARPIQVDTLISLQGIVGRGFIVHAGEDIGTQPSGGAGPRVAQCVIGVANPDA